MPMERKNDHQPFGIEYLQRLPLTGRMDGSVQYFYLCGLLCILASIMLLLKKEPPHSLIVLCQVGVLPVIVSQHPTA